MRQLPYIVFSGRKRMAIKIDQVEIFDGMREAIEPLHASGASLYILSTGSTRAIESFLSRYEIKHCFKAVIGNVSLLGKARSLSKLIKKEQLQVAGTVYVGDEIRDIVAAKQANIRSVAVGWGFNSVETLRGAQPSALAGSASELAATIGSLTEYDKMFS